MLGNTQTRPFEESTSKFPDGVFRNTLACTRTLYSDANKASDEKGPVTSLKRFSSFTVSRSPLSVSESLSDESKEEEESDELLQFECPDAVVLQHSLFTLGHPVEPLSLIHI